MREALEAEFARHYGAPPDARASAPGRVNLIGEHTDYNAGLVLPCAIDRHTLVLGRRVPGRGVRAFSLSLGPEPVAAAWQADRFRARGEWSDYVRAPFAAFAEAGHGLGGVELGIASDVPLGSGLSSSAALGVSVCFLLDRLFGLGLERRALADLAHRAESHFVGLGCGLLDHYASALGRAGCALRIDCRDRTVREVPIGGGGFALLVARSGVTRELAKGGYRERVRECGEALARAREAGVAPPGAKTLRDLDPTALPALEAALPGRLFRRVRHVLTENARVERFCAALGEGSLEEAGAILGEGMASLRDDYQVSIPELDALCALADAQPGALGSRLTGAGFGGCTLHLVRAEAADEVAAAIRRGYREQTGRDAEPVVVHPGDGARAEDA